MTVKIVKSTNYNIQTLEKQISEAIGELGIDLKGKKTAVLKPNIVISAKPGSAIITHPAPVLVLTRIPFLEYRDMRIWLYERISGSSISMNQNERG